MENIPLFGSLAKCPDEDNILTDLKEEVLTEWTLVAGFQWSDLRQHLLNDPFFNGRAFVDSLRGDEVRTFIRLAEA